MVMMHPDVHKINNSYETESSCSKESSNEASSMSSEWDFINEHQQLKDFLFPNLNLIKRKSDKKRKESSNINMHTENNQEMNESISPMLKLSEKELFPALNELNVTPSNDRKNTSLIEQTFGSDEISYQGNACQSEHVANTLNYLRKNSNLMDVSQLSIEPSSSPSDDDEKPMASKVFTSSVDENSSNAVNSPFAIQLTVKKESTLIASPENKMNVSKVLAGERSPDLFADDDIEDVVAEESQIDKNATDASLEMPNIGDNSLTTMNWESTEKTISKRIQTLLSGILPPPSVTHCQHDIASMLILYKINSESMKMADTLPLIDAEVADENGNFKPKEIDETKWPEIVDSSCPGIHYNRTKYTENIESMYMKLAERHVSQETGSSFTLNAREMVKKPIRKVIASPGNRLSHLAKRRAIFSSANLLSQANFSNAAKLGRKPCTIDASKLMRKEKPLTPKRRIMGGARRTPNRRTPGSKKKSAKKLPLILPTASTATRETSKRALFLSPTQENVQPAKSTSEHTIRAEKSKRALFSPPRRLERSISNSAYISSTSSIASSEFIAMKRKRENDDENIEPRATKLAKCQSTAFLTRLSSAEFAHSNTIQKAASENSVYIHQQLSASHKQKLLWAVSTALKKKSITTSHENFNSYASVLAKVVKRLYLESVTSKMESTSATMLRLSDRLVFWVIQGKTVDEIYLDEKNRQEAAKNALKKPTGYIGPEEFALQKELLNKSITSTSTECATSQSSTSADRKPLTNSSSKSNLGMSTLRENHDSKSAQKNASANVNFSGRNQKNLSPYNANKQKLLVGNSIYPNLLKVKRQISFDN